jgi:type VI secretion system secreted protein Hcp
MAAPFSGSSSDIFLAVQAKRAGRVKGEATAPDHEDDIDVESWRWSVQAASALGSTAATTRRSYSGLTVVKRVDSASTALLAALATNDEIKEAKLTMRKAGEGQQDYFLLTLSEARVTSVEHAVGDDGGTREIITFAFRKVEVEYRPQQKSGGRGGSHIFNDEILAAG